MKRRTETLAPQRSPPTPPRRYRDVMSMFDRVRAVLGGAKTSDGVDQLTSTAISSELPAPSTIEPDERTLALVPATVARGAAAVPLSSSTTTLVVAMEDPTDQRALDELRASSGREVSAVPAPRATIAAALDRLYRDPVAHVLDDIADLGDLDELGHARDGQMTVFDLAPRADESPIVKLVNLILVDAVKKRSSDIHLEPYEKEYRVRYRIDGTLHEVMKPPLRLKDAIAARLRTMAAIGPKDAAGRIALRLGGGKTVFFRVAFVPTAFGDVGVVRVIDPDLEPPTVAGLYLPDDELKAVERAYRDRRGLVLLASPVGGGRSTTLRTLARTVTERAVAVGMVERMSELPLHGVSQVQVGARDDEPRHAQGASMLAGADCELILVDDAPLAALPTLIRLARGGSMITATVAAASVADAVALALEAGVPARGLADVLTLVIAQRLVPQPCPACQTTPATTTSESCTTCWGVGHVRRQARYDVVPVDDVLGAWIVGGADRGALAAARRRP